MLAHAIEDTDFAKLDAADFIAEWKWDGIRVQAVSGRDDDGSIVTRLYSRTGEDITRSFPDLLPSLRLPGAIDGELLVLRDGRVQIVQRAAAAAEPQDRHAEADRRNIRSICAPTICSATATTICANCRSPSAARRLEAFVARLDDPRIDLSPTDRLRQLGGARRRRAPIPASAGAGEDAEAVEGVMLKRRDAPYLPGRPKGQWWKWKRDPHIIDAVLMYAQRGHGKRSSYYSDYTFGVWTSGEDGEQLVPVGKAYFGFTDEELLQIDRFVRRNTTEKFGPVRQVVHEPDQGLVLEVAFEGLARSPRHKSGVAMRFPRISRLRWDKPPREADRLETLERMLKSEATHPVRARSSSH